jgi:hypothetical protein
MTAMKVIRNNRHNTAVELAEPACVRVDPAFRERAFVPKGPQADRLQTQNNLIMKNSSGCLRRHFFDGLHPTICQRFSGMALAPVENHFAQTERAGRRDSEAEGV